MKVIYLVYPGLGKTYCQENFPHKYADIHVSHFKNMALNKYGGYIPENLKGENLEFINNPDFPQNILQFINIGFRQNKIMLMALKPSNTQFLIDNGFDFVFVMPAKNKLRELEMQYINRGNTKSYIMGQLGRYDQICENIKKYNKKIIFVKKGKHLDDCFKD